MNDNKDKVISLHWFRQDLRVHDNAALMAAAAGADRLYPVFIFDGKVASEYEFHYYLFQLLQLPCWSSTSIVAHSRNCDFGEVLQIYLLPTCGYWLSL